MRIDILNKLARQGESFTFRDAQEIVGSDASTVKKLLSRFENKGLVQRIEKGKYIILPLGAEKGHYTLHEFVIASLLVNPYCISYWSALHFYGFTEQIPNVVFVQTTAYKKVQEKEVLGIRYKFVKVKKEKFFAVEDIWIENSKVNIAEREKTIVDCLDKPQYCGGIIEVAKALKHGTYEKRKLTRFAKQIGNSGVIRRLGFLSEYVGRPVKLPVIKARNYLYLDPTMPHKGEKNARWRLILNLDEKDLGSLE